MADKLDFSLPQKKSPGSKIGVATLVLLLVLLALVSVHARLTVEMAKRMPRSVSGTGLSEEQAKDLASKLAQRGLYQQAAAAWQEYLTSAQLAGLQRAQIHFQIGGLLEKAGLYGDAIEHFYRSEAAAKVDELGPQINAHVKECFERLGKFSALRYELMDRTSIGSTQPAGGKVVAEIGAEKITESQLDALIEESIDDQLTPMRAFMAPEQINEQKKRALEQLRAPQAKQEFLQSWLAQEILYRQALDQQLGDEPEVKRFLHSLTRQALSRQMLDEQLASKIHITDTDVQTYYTANKDKYVEPAKAKISHILVADEQKANDLLKLAQEGNDFAELARGSSLDASTKDSGGKIPADVQPGSYVPGIGDSNDLNANIFAAEGGKILDKPFKTDKGWEIVRLDEKHPSRQKTFDEVRQQVMRELLSRKSEEVQRDYIKEMMDKHQVVIHTSVLAPARQESPQEVSPKP
ncbi:MAG TPA: peptidyl-prolyl cis-trans isomerase [Sedimentisphaerales bacterium]|jgi:peptidyl-prolyl cis-trans isomerase C|nr:peptidyl-prolyl cis-trans isomerase [Sedimentisphaerales bacterium]HNU28689.1 peptidyl-prolyl cis-trans isomerase [Sedimentisphaerales bacterium]